MEQKAEFLGIKVEARNIQRVIMSWETHSAIPLNVVEYQQALKLFREKTMLKTLIERDYLTEQYYTSKEGKSEISTRNRKKSREATILESVNIYSKEHHIISSFFKSKAEISVSHNVLDVAMI